MSTDAPRPTGALTISPTQTDWTAPQREALSVLWQDRNGRPRFPDHGTSLRFLDLVQRTGLNPFASQVYLIERGGKWTTQTGIDGFRVIRDRIATQRGLLVGYAPTFYCGKDGQWTDVWLQDGPPLAAKVTVEVTGPAGTAAFPQVALWREYGSDSGQWRKMPTTMLAKVAEAQALRRAFPQDLSGLYTSDEMAQAEPAAGPGHTIERGTDAPPAPAAAPLEDPQVAVDGVLGSLIVAATLDELRACWDRLRELGATVAETVVDVPLAWQDDSTPPRLPLYRLVNVAKAHLDDDPHAGEPEPTPAPAAAWPEPAVPADAHPDTLPTDYDDVPDAGCVYAGCDAHPTDGPFCADHQPRRRPMDADPEPADPRQADREKGRPTGQGRAAMAKARADLAARTAAKAAQA